MEFNKANTRKILAIIIFTLFFLWVVLNWNTVINFFDKAFELVFPFILGIAIAFVLNILTKFFEEKVFGVNLRKRGKNKIKKIQTVKSSAWKRVISLILAIIVLLAIIALVIGLVIPELIKTVQMLFASLPDLLENGKVYIADLLREYPQINTTITDLQNSIENININEELNKFLNTYGSGILATSVNVISGMAGAIVTFVLALAFALYALVQKEKLILQSKKLLYAYVRKDKADKVMRVARTANTTFTNFISGQFVEALILGFLCMLGMLILDIPHAVTIGVMIAFTALIPIVGAIIGTVIGAILILPVSPIKAVVFVIFLLILQQIEGNIIYPKVVGSSVGLPGIWVLVAISIGGSLWGLVGILLSVPLFSVIYAVLGENVNHKLKEKNLQIE